MGRISDIVSRISPSLGVYVKLKTKTVFCPEVPRQVFGTSASAYAALDQVGSLITIRVPESGILHSVSLYDPADQGSSLRVHFFKEIPALAGDNNVWSLSDGDTYNRFLALTFSTFEDDINNRSAYTYGINYPFRLRSTSGSYFMRIVLSTPAASTPTYPLASPPRIQLGILSDDPDFIPETS